MRKINICILLAVLCLPIVLANTAVSGDIHLNWDNAYNRPQQFSGPISGDLSGTISLTTNTDYDTATGAVTIGVTHSEDVKLVLSDTTCDGFYDGSNVNQGRNAGTWVATCDNGNTLIGSMYGVNDATGNIDAKYSGFVIQPVQGPKGDKGEQGVAGSNGKDGLNGVDGKDGKDGSQGIQGEKGDAGLPGIQGIKGDTGDRGLQGENGPQGIQGLKGDTGASGATGAQGAKGDKGDQGIQGVKGDTGATGLQGPQGVAGINATVDLSSINARITFILSQLCPLGYNSTTNACNVAPFVCTTGQLKCTTTALNTPQYICSNNAWVVNQTCAYGCNVTANVLTQGKCNLPPFVCTTGSLKCSGNDQMICGANVWNKNQTCANGCNATTSLCNPAPQPTTDNCVALKGQVQSYYCYTSTFSATKKYDGNCGGQGTNTACASGMCQSYLTGLNSCAGLCVQATGKCV